MGGFVYRFLKMKKNKDWADLLAEEIISEIKIKDISPSDMNTISEIAFSHFYNSNFGNFEVKQNNTSTNKKQKDINKESMGMFFFDVSSILMKDLKISYQDRQTAEYYYFMLGVACQGRTDEIENNYSEFLKHKPEFKYHLEELKPHLYKISSIAKEINSQRLKCEIGESVGEFLDRKYSENEVYCKEFSKLKSLYIKDFNFERYK